MTYINFVKYDWLLCLFSYYHYFAEWAMFLRPAILAAVVPLFKIVVISDVSVYLKP